MSTIYIVIKHEEDYLQTISTAISAHSTRASALAEAARLDSDVAWPRNRPDYDGNKIDHCVYEIPMSTPLDIAPPVAAEMTPAAFVALVRAGKVRAKTPDGDSAVHVDRAIDYGEDSQSTVIGWACESYVPNMGRYELGYAEIEIFSGTESLCRNKGGGYSLHTSGVVFHITD